VKIRKLDFRYREKKKLESDKRGIKWITRAGWMLLEK